MIPPAGHTGLYHTALFGRQAAVQERRRHPGGGEAVHLVLHQGDQRRDHHGQLPHRRRRRLIAERLPAPRRQDDDGIPPRQHRADGLFLQREEGIVAPHPLHDASDVLHSTPFLSACDPRPRQPARSGFYADRHEAQDESAESQALGLPAGRTDRSVFGRSVLA